MTDRAGNVDDLLVPVALGIADEEEVVLVERAAATDPDLARRLEGLRETTAVLAEDVPQVEPPASLRKAVVKGVRAEGRGAASADRRPLLRWLAGAATGAVVAGAIAAGVIIGTGDSDSPGLREVPIEQAAGPISGELVVFPDDDPAVLRLRDLPPVPDGVAYELWRISGSEVVSGGFLEVTADGTGAIAIPDTADVEVLAVTAEERTNTEAPTTDPLVEVEVPA